MKPSQSASRFSSGGISATGNTLGAERILPKFMPFHIMATAFSGSIYEHEFATESEAQSTLKKFVKDQRFAECILYSGEGRNARIISTVKIDRFSVQWLKETEDESEVEDE